MAKGPRHRYAGCQELADDLRRWLAGAPVAARPLGLLERSARWVRRNRGLSAGLAAAMLALVLGTAVASWQAVSARKSAAREAEERGRAEAARRVAEEKTEIADVARRTAEEEKKAADDARRKEEEENYFLVIARAAQQVRENQPLQAEERLLALGRKDHRSRWEWGYLLERCRQLKEQADRHGKIRCVRLSPDGKWLAWARDDGCVLLRELTPEGLPLQLCKGRQAIHCLAFSADNTRLAAGADGGRIRVWSVPEGKECFAPQAHQGPVTALAFHPLDNNQLASGGSDHFVFSWDFTISPHKRRTSFPGQTDTIRSVLYWPDGSRLVAFSRANTVMIWDRSGTRLDRFEGYTTGAFSPTGEQLAIANKSGTIDVYRSLDLTKVYSYQGHGSPVQQVDFCMSAGKEGYQVASVAEDGIVRVWETRTGQTDPRSFDAAGNPGPGQKFRTDTLGRYRDYVHCLVASSKGLLATGAGVGARPGRGLLEGEVRFRHLADDRLGRVLPRHDQPLWAVAFHLDGSLLASASRDGCVRLWESARGTLRSTLIEKGDPVAGLAFSPDGKRLASAGYDRTVKVWDTAAGQEALTLQEKTTCFQVAFSPDGQRLIAATAKGVRVYTSPGRDE